MVPGLELPLEVEMIPDPQRTALLVCLTSHRCRSSHRVSHQLLTKKGNFHSPLNIGDVGASDWFLTLTVCPSLIKINANATVNRIDKIKQLVALTIWTCCCADLLQLFCKNGNG